MSDELLPYYNRELAFIRALGGEFAEKHPKIAGRLRLGPDASQDPHVERMVQAFAYLNARVRHKLDDDFPELTDGMLGVLYPHYQNPLPSMSILQLSLDRSQGEMIAGYEVPQGTFLESEPVDGDKCRFQSTYPLRLWPIVLQQAQLLGRPFAAPSTPKSQQAVAILRLDLTPMAKAAQFNLMDLQKLRFYLYAAKGQNVFKLYELLFTNVLEIGLATGPNDPNPVLLPATAIEPVGFAKHEGMLPYPPRSFIGYRLLSEFFAFPEKFLFFDLAGLTKSRLAKFTDRMEVYLYLNQTTSDLERSVTKETFRLGCTPIVNLFPQRAEPTGLNHTQHEYRIVPDARRESALEIYSVDKVIASSTGGVTQEYRPFFSFKHVVDREAQQTFYQASRKPTSAAQSGNIEITGSEVYLSLVDLGFSPSLAPGWTLDVQTTCFNRDLPSRLPFGRGRPSFEMPDGKGPIGEILCLTAPTSTRRPALKRLAMWRLVSHLNLNHLSLSETSEGASSLREILKLYDFTDSPQTRGIINGLLRLGCHRVVGRAGGLAGGFCRGLEISLHLDEDKFSGSGAFLFASVLDRFLGLYVTVNSFTRLVASTEQRKDLGEFWKWAPRAGEKVLL